MEISKLSNCFHAISKLRFFAMVVFFAIEVIANVPQKLYAQELAAGISATPTVTKSATQTEDTRVKVLKGFLASYNSPLEPSAAAFVKTADTYNIDWRLLVAISGVESTFGHQIPYNSYNAWGWGIYGNNIILFASWDEAIETISKSLRQDYMDNWGAQDVYQIGRFYAASPTWAQRVDYFMQKITEYELKNPKDALSLSL